MTTEIVICGHCGGSVGIIRSPKPLPNYLQCPNANCGKNMMAEGVKIKHEVQRNLYLEHEKRKERMAEGEDLEDDIIKKLKEMIKK